MHWQLTGEKVLGVGDASGMFPIDIADRRLRQRDARTGSTNWPPSRELELRLADLLPTIRDRRGGRPAS